MELQIQNNPFDTHTKKAVENQAYKLWKDALTMANLFDKDPCFKDCKYCKRLSGANPCPIGRTRAVLLTDWRDLSTVFIHQCILQDILLDQFSGTNYVTPLSSEL